VSAGTANGEDVPAELAPQIPLVREALECLGITVIGVDDHEADDVLGALVRSWSGESLVVSGDRDLFQLADDERQSAVVYIGAGIKKREVVTDTWLADKYGLAPGQYG
jgi:5'-3' exonuclease